MMKTTCIKTICLLFSILVLGACSKDEEVFTGNIAGKVTDAATGEVLQGVTVTITPGGDARTTGSDGYFEFRDLEPKQYEIQARKSGYTTNNKTVTVITGYDVPGDIQLAPVVQDGKLALSVSSLNFGSQNSSLSFSIQNNGNATFNWNISGLDKVDWLSVNPTTGTLVAGKSNAVTVTLNRDRVTEYKEATILVNADDESVALKITAEAEVKTSKIALTSSVLNFGTAYSSLTFDVKNIGNAGDVNWDITGIDAAWIKVTPTAGTTAMGKSSAVKVDIDREKLVEERNTTNILVNADGESLRVTINAEKGNGNNDDGNGGGYTGEVVVKSGLQAYYPFDDETADDWTENELDGILYESPIFSGETPNGRGKALFLNTNKYPNQVLNIPYNPLKGLTAYSISLWVKDFSAGIFLGAVDGNSWDDYMCLYYKENGRIACMQRVSSEFSGYNAASLIDGNWHMLTYVQVSGNAKLYVDGKLVDSQATGGVSNISVEGTVGGTRMLVDNNMKMDNLRIYNRKLSADEVIEIYNAEK
ncbi:MAG: carboxypeptidase regulatory-like domain-containing protein [Bacteroidaceae bacterium]|nr:carboxypeptidase regulatory-like domain-containing protein [Bacteroidaceae bacterium]